MNSFVYALVAALANVAGGLAVARGAKLGLRFITGCLAFSAGFMLAVAILAMLPAAFERSGPAAAGYVLLGYLLVHLSQHTLIPHFHFGEETHHISRATGVSALIGLLLHTFFDGVAIASAFLVSPRLGLLMFAAIFLHKLPEGVAISSIQLAGGLGRASAVGSAALLGAATVAGVLLTDVVGLLTLHGLALAAGVTLYVGASNLVPEVQQRHGAGLSTMFFVGAGMYFVGLKVMEIVGLH